MTVRMDSLVRVIAVALDIVENGLLGASTNHGKRISVLCAKMGKVLGKNPDEITALAICAMLHDNALTEYILSEQIDGQQDPAMKKHCEFGQKNVDALHFKTNVKDFILYHHEHADGSGPFGIREGEGPLEAELICIADSLDVLHHFQRLEQEDLPSIRKFITDETGKHYAKTATLAMLEILDWPLLLSLKDNAVRETAEAAFDPWIVHIETDTIFGLADFVARITDYKSVYTRRHSAQVANIAWLMGGYYQNDPVERAKLYLAASLHDIGKLAVPTSILDKPEELDDTEYSIIKEHALLTHELLRDVEGFGDICEWASNHHEKFSGRGYPFGKKREMLDFNSRLLACIDIYQASREDRPYHPARNHDGAIRILFDIANMGEVDGDITKDMDTVLAPYDGMDVPQPDIFLSS